MLKLINPKGDRHRSNVKSMIKMTCDIAEQFRERPLSGYALVAWDSAGNTAVKYKSGGIVSPDAVPSHVFSQLVGLNAALDAKGNRNYED